MPTTDILLILAIAILFELINISYNININVILRQLHTACRFVVLVSCSDPIYRPKVF